MQPCRRGESSNDFYNFISAAPPNGSPDFKRLREGLDELRDADIEDALMKLNVSGLVLANEKDPLVPLATSECLSSLKINGKFMLHSSTGHLLPQTFPDWCASAIADFITSCIHPA